MRFYTKQHKFYCGIDLHAKSMYLCILDQAGNVVLHRNIHTKPENSQAQSLGIVKTL